jgi:DNA invertase Pin-like site-specific DNA recombinase
VTVLNDLKRRAVKFQSLAEAIDADRTRDVADAWVFAELERNLITERTRAGVKAIEEQGRESGGGR